eukprot:scpid42417/ scgid4978/ InaD-like protein; Pals1-associated tight junction protein; Protein associated to tight junctions
MASDSEVVLVKQGFLKCPPFDKEMSFHERWPRYWCVVAGHNSPTGQSHYFLYFFNQQPRNIKQILANIPAASDGKANGDLLTNVDKSSPTMPAEEGIILALPLRDCYYLRRCHQHSYYKNLFSICFSHASYFLAPETGSAMESWIMTFCEHLDINCEEDQKPRPKNGRMQQRSLSHFRHSSIKQKFQSVGDKGSRRPNTLPFPPAASSTGVGAGLTHTLPVTGIPGLITTPATGAYSSPSIGSLDSYSSLSTAFSSDVSLASSRTAPPAGMNTSSLRHVTSKLSVTKPMPSDEDEEEICHGMKELTSSISAGTAYRSLALITQRSSSQDSLSQVDSGVSYDRDGTPSSALHPDGADIIAMDTGPPPPPVPITVDNPFIRSPPTPNHYDRAPSATLSGHSTLTSQSTIVLPSSGRVSSSQIESPFLSVRCESTATQLSDTMHHDRMSGIFSGSLPQLKKSTSATSTGSRASLPCRSTPVNLSSEWGGGPSGDTATFGQDQFRHRAYSKTSADFKTSTARASPAFAAPSARSMISVKLTVKIQRSLAMEHLLLVDAFNYVWVAGWNSIQHPHVFHVGDQLLSINAKACSKASTAVTDIQSSGLEVELVIVRTPVGNEVSIQRHSTSEILGLGLRKSTITSIYPNTAASRSGVNLQAQGMNGKLVPWVVTQINSVPVNLFNTDRDKVMQQLNASGFYITLLLQPKDFISALKKKVRSSPSCKQFMHVPSSIGGLQSHTQAMKYSQPIIVHLSKSRSTLGITVKGGADMPQHYITIDDVDESGVAHSDGFLKRGMEILAVDGISLAGRAHCEAVQLIRKCFVG